jgi:dienelactone hydrolase
VPRQLFGQGRNDRARGRPDASIPIMPRSSTMHPSDGTSGADSSEVDSSEVGSSETDSLGIDRRTFAKSAVVAAGALLGVGSGVVAPARAASELTLVLPSPTGPQSIGYHAIYLVDRSRPDPWDPTIPVRELMVSVFYPARGVRGYPLAPQMPAGTAAVFGVIAPYQHPQLPTAGVNWAGTMTYAHIGAPAQARPAPVFLYSPGAGDPRPLGTIVAEELASRGAVVVTIDHPGDADAVEFPNVTPYRGRVRETALTADPWTEPAVFRTMIDTRIADTKFVLDQLELLAAGQNPDALGRPLPSGLSRSVDPRRIGMYGHSAGGTTAAETMYEDHRIGAAVNLEGYLDYPPDASGQPGPLFPVAQDGVDRPMLLLGTDGFRDADIDRSWSAMLDHPGGRTSWRQIDDAEHWTLTDYAAMAPQMQAAGLMTAAGRDQLVGTIAPAVSVPLVSEYVVAFFARELPAD